MDYLSFGLLAGSLIVIASFVVRDGLPHLSAVPRHGRLGRLSRAETPMAWVRWCADTGLVLSSAGTLVLLLTIAVLLVGPSDSLGNMVVGLSVSLAVVCSVLGSARLAQRLGRESEAELAGELAEPAWREPEAVPARMGPTPAQTPSVVAAVALQPGKDEALVETVAGPLDDGADDVWDDELPTWSASAAAPPSATIVTELASPNERVAAPRNPGSYPLEPTPPLFATSVRDAIPPVTDGLFSSPLLADIGLTTEDGVDDITTFQSPLLSALYDDPESVDTEFDTGSDLLIDEAPVPLQPASRSRDAAGGR